MSAGMRIFIFFVVWIAVTFITGMIAWYLDEKKEKRRQRLLAADKRLDDHRKQIIEQMIKY